MNKAYPAVFHLEDGGYWVNFPDLSGCYSDGDTLEETLENAQEALALHLSALLDNDQELPAATDLTSIAVTDGVSLVLPLTPNADTLAAINDVENERDLSPAFDNIQELMDSLNA